MKAEDRNDRDVIFKLMREHEYVIGSNKLTILAIDSLIESIKSLNCNSLEETRKQLKGLFAIIRETEPKVIPLIHLLESLEADIDLGKNKTVKMLKGKCLKVLKEKRIFFMDKMVKTAEHGVKSIEDKDVIILHSVSSVVLNILIRAKKKGINFEVLVLEQDSIKTTQIVKVMQEHKIKFSVIPEFNLSHVVEKATKLFIGAIAVTKNMKSVTAIGTANVVSLAHINDLPVYLFVNSLKFSNEGCNKQRIYRKKRTRGEHVKYDADVYSHDLVDLSLIENIITEDGKVAKKKIKEYLSCKHK